MGKLRKIVPVIMCIVMVFALCACSMVFVNEERDNAQVVAEVNGEKILKGRAMETIDYYMQSYYGSTFEEYKKTATKKEVDEFVEGMLDELVREELVYQQAKKEGLEDTSEENRQAKKDEINETLEMMKDYYYDSEEAQNYDNPEAWAEEQYQNYIETYGYDDIEAYVDAQIRQEAISAMRDKINEEVSYTEEEAKEYYDSLLEGQKEIIDNDPSQYSMYEQFDQVYYRPAGARYVKHILIALPEDVQTEISALRTEGNEEAADELRAGELALIKDKADEALARAKNGEDFDELVAELGEDPGMQSEPGLTDGYLVIEGSSDYVAEFEAGSIALENVGDISSLVPSDFGYHIIKYVKDVSGEVPFDEVKDSIISSNLSTQQSNHYVEYADGLKEESVIKTYPDRL